jgi:hypothetical protein
MDDTISPGRRHDPSPPPQLPHTGGPRPGAGSRREDMQKAVSLALWSATLQADPPAAEDVLGPAYAHTSILFPPLQPRVSKTRRQAKQHLSWL